MNGKLLINLFFVFSCYLILSFYLHGSRNEKKKEQRATVVDAEGSMVVDHYEELLSFSIR